ncbi:hypothetical protein [Pararcticibacter amylolyticus]|uniref:Uncharacterized protein n=1 Tax=Pararcticibacter amylolyticus TaxID=2173175 RepID=A0A2U2PIW0_9SPHI|nr:hypothetical protein [Pararcticibacter amylolyticus]PWG81343.1 hypothetical protein DDR33_08220 [Pararcticibacter amylolyticus]
MQIKKNIQIVVSLFFLLAGNVNAQDHRSNELKQNKINSLSQRLKISINSATKIVELMEHYTNLSNKIYHDSSLTTEQKVDKLDALEREKLQKLGSFSKVEGKLNGKEKLAPLLKKQEKSFSNK